MIISHETAIQMVEEIPGMNGPFSICTCDCHGKVDIMHCMPCCDKTYVKYSQELWDKIPDIQASLDLMKSRLASIQCPPDCPTKVKDNI